MRVRYPKGVSRSKRNLCDWPCGGSEHMNDLIVLVDAT